MTVLEKLLEMKGSVGFNPGDSVNPMDPKPFYFLQRDNHPGLSSYVFVHDMSVAGVEKGIDELYAQYLQETPNIRRQEELGKEALAYAQGTWRDAVGGGTVEDSA